MNPPAPTARQDSSETWLRALSRVMARITANADRESVLISLAAGLVDEFDVALSAIWLYNPADDALHLRANAGVNIEKARVRTSVPVASAQGPVAEALATRKVVIIDPLGPESFFNSDWLASQGLRVYAGFPLVVGDRVNGVMVVFLRHSPPPGMLEALGVLAQQAALALEYVRLLEESHTLQAIAADLASAPDARALLEGLVQRTMGAFGADGCAVWLLYEDNVLRAAASGGLSADFVEGIHVSPTRRTASNFIEVRRTRRPLYTRDDVAVARAADATLADHLSAEGIVSALRLPLFEPGGEVVGLLALYHRRERPYSDEEIRMAQTFTNQIAVALHNIRLAGKERDASAAAARQLERLTALAGITERLLGSPDLDAVLRVVVENAGRLCDASMALVGLIDAGRRLMRTVAAEGPMRDYFLSEDSAQELNEPFLTGTAAGRAFSTGETVVIEDYTTLPVVAPSQAATVAAGARAIICVPLRTGGEPIGVLWVADSRPRVFDPADVALIAALADQAALAIEHARLVRRGQEAAVLEERARLARDLHDSVTQSVFSLGMMARAAQAQHARGSTTLGRTLQRVSELARDALIEMRALVFELRPAGLGEDGLSAALEKLVASLRVRVDLPVTFTGHPGADVRLSEETETAVFRIVQEALGNAAKHANATSVRVTLAVEGDRLIVTVADDGVGFDPFALPEPAAGSGGMGMLSMRERALDAGLALSITSSPGEGAEVKVEAVIPAQQLNPAATG